MKIALLGYGKMGRIIDELLVDSSDEVVLRIDADKRANLRAEDLQAADVIIEFSHPDAVLDNIALALEAGVPMVCGTTGWLKEQSTVARWVAEKQGSFFYASNFSVGVHIFFALNRYLSTRMAGFADYLPSMSETHHIHKVDAPSGTAVTLAEDLVQAHPQLDDWALQATHWPDKVVHTPTSAPGKSLLPITSYREGEVPGTHHIRWQSPIDEISIEHKAHSRKGFAQGAITAAHWLVGKQGYFGMEDMLNLHP